jgi:hypothetical protein
MTAINDLAKEQAAAWEYYCRALDLVSDAEALLETIEESDLFDHEVAILGRILVEKMNEGVAFRRAYTESLRVKKNIILDAMEADERD